MKPRQNYQLKPEYIERIKKLLPEKSDYESYLESLKTRPTRSIRCNTLKIKPDELKKRLEEKYKWQIVQPFKKNPEIMIVEGKIAETKVSDDEKINENDKSSINNSISICERSERSRGGGRGRGGQKNKNLENLEPGELGRALEHLLGYYYIQDIASMLPIIALQPNPEETLLDLCAAPGSKTTQAAALMKNTGNIIANEISLGRLKILASNSERCGVTNTILTKKEGTALCKKFQKENIKFDKILLDAPCSGEGTFCSKPKTYSMWNPKTIKSLSHLQKQLFKEAFEILETNGEMIYSTCTHAPEENEEIVDWALTEFKDKIKVEKITLPKEFNSRPGITEWDKQKYSKEVTKSIRVYPHDSNTEGFFLAKFKKTK
jgi:tRNA (cytosine49-C5)-methyltransferase